jgi:hypothetical protein
MSYCEQGELTGSLKWETAMVISSQATYGAKARDVEGSETRAREKSVMAPRVPCPAYAGGDIVRYSGETRRASLNS